MTIRLRPHHLLCILTYVGKGYSDAFADNCDRIARRLAGGEDVVIVDGPDDICAPLLNDAEPHCLNDSVKERDRLARRDLRGFLAAPIKAGGTLELDPVSVTTLRKRFSAGDVRAACTGCEWFELCSAVAADNFNDARL